MKVKIRNLKIEIRIKSEIQNSNGEKFRYSNFN